MIWSGVRLLVSGAILSFPEAIPWKLRFLAYAGVLVHVACALVTIGAFIIHVYIGTAMVRGGFTSIIRGEVSPAWARLHHRLWYERVAGK
jgi:formate dehydrogenase subunit gamma